MLKRPGALLIPALLLWPLVASPSVFGQANPNYEVYAIEYGSIPNWDVTEMVPGAESPLIVDGSLMVWLVRDPEGRNILVDTGCLPDNPRLSPFDLEWYIRPDQAVAKLGSDRADDEDETGLAPQKADWTLTTEEWENLLANVEESRFWADDSSLEQLGWLRVVGRGGEEWIFEGWRDGQHSVRTVWNPDEERAYAAYALGRSFVKSLPDWFALEMARLWTADSGPGIHPRLVDKLNLG